MLQHVSLLLDRPPSHAANVGVPRACDALGSAPFDSTTYAVLKCTSSLQLVVVVDADVQRLHRVLIPRGASREARVELRPVLHERGVELREEDVEVVPKDGAAPNEHFHQPQRVDDQDDDEGEDKGAGEGHEHRVCCLVGQDEEGDVPLTAGVDEDGGDVGEDLDAALQPVDVEHFDGAGVMVEGDLRHVVREDLLAQGARIPVLDGALDRRGV
mmetsp:Transcript_13948/g.24322  ORF Transcript_13948/g.24322 Transcript_13948/m.24322 type:complete len:214 (-) Transcript_13948:105-746(-)